MGKVIKYRSIKKYKYELMESVILLTGIIPYTAAITPFLSITHNGLLNIRKGYAWDGASGPSVDTDNIMRGSLVHDALYQLIRDGIIDPTKKPAVDALLRKICLEDGMSKFRAWYVWKAVVWFGTFALKPLSIIIKEIGR